MSIIKEDILRNIENANALEVLYRENKSAFKREFNVLYPDLKGNELAEFWHERLNFENPDISWGTSTDIAFVVFASLISGFIAKLPEVIPVKEEYFYLRNAGFIVFPFLTLYFAWKRKADAKRLLILGSVTLAAILFINLLPDKQGSDTVLLSCLHLQLFLWVLLGFSFIGKDIRDAGKRIDFLRYNGDLVVMTTLILISGMILTGITIGLFSLIHIDIRTFYFKFTVVFGLAASPLVGTYITQSNPQLVGKVSPVIAKVFSPLVLITLFIYMISVFYSGMDPYKDRQFLLMFNGLLIGVMAIILFSVAETGRTDHSKAGTLILFLLSLLTIIVNGIALSAILFRISEWGFTPNRLAVLGGNILILVNLLIVTYRIFRNIKNNDDLELVEHAISNFLPIYLIWTGVVTFTFPFIFNFK